jgi:hypothetical protein
MCLSGLALSFWSKWGCSAVKWAGLWLPGREWVVREHRSRRGSDREKGEGGFEFCSLRHFMSKAALTGAWGAAKVGG